jgi:hypothetical protein
MIKILNVLFFAGMILMNFLANSLPLNNVTTGQLSDSYPNLFVPAGITFSIWGIIYLLLLIFCVMQFTVTGTGQQAVSSISWMFALSCILNALWIVCWHYRQLAVSLLVMLAILVTLIFINMSLRSFPAGLIKAAFGIYLGWICIATIANVTTLLVNYGWNGFGIHEQTWAIIMIIFGALIVSATIIRLNNPFIGLSVVWAFIGIALKRQGDYRSVFFTALAAMAIVAGITIYGFLKKNML